MRAATLPLTAACGAATTWLIATNRGTTGFALYSLVATLPAFLIASDLGLGAAVTDAIARRAALAQTEIEDVTAITTQATLVLGALIGGVAVVLGALGVWTEILGARTGGVTSAAVATFCVFGASLPAAVGARVLLGLEKNHLVVAFTAVASAFVLAFVGLMIALDAPTWLLTVGPAGSVACVGLLQWKVAGRYLTLHGIFRVRGIRKTRATLRRALTVAGPMAVISSVLPLGLQSDRLVLSHVVGLHGVAKYSAGAQVFQPCLSLITAAGMQYWPRFTRLRATGSPVTAAQFGRILRGFAFAGLLLGGALVLVGPWLTSFMTDGKARADVGLMGCFAALLMANALYYPVGMYATDPPGLRLQAAGAVGMTIVNVALSVLLAFGLGVRGPVVGSAIAMLLCYFGPAAIYTRRSLVDKASAVSGS